MKYLVHIGNEYSANPRNGVLREFTTCDHGIMCRSLFSPYLITITNSRIDSGEFIIVEIPKDPAAYI